MIPDSVATVVGFLLLLAPGIVWQLDRDRYRPSLKESAFLELSRIILVSLVATVTVAVLLVPRMWLPLLDRVGELREAVSPNLDDAMLFVFAAGVHSMAATGLAWATSRLAHSGPPPIVNERVWHLALSTWHAAGSANPRLIVELLDGTIWKGPRLAFDAGIEDESRWIALGQPLRRRRLNEQFIEIAPTYQTVLIPEREIKSIQVASVVDASANQRYPSQKSSFRLFQRILKRLRTNH